MQPFILLHVKWRMSSIKWDLEWLFGMLNISWQRLWSENNGQDVENDGVHHKCYGAVLFLLTGGAGAEPGGPGLIYLHGDDIRNLRVDNNCQKPAVRLLIWITHIHNHTHHYCYSYHFFPSLCQHCCFLLFVHSLTFMPMISHSTIFTDIHTCKYTYMSKLYNIFLTNRHKMF